MFEQLAAGADLFVHSYSGVKFEVEQAVPFDADWLHLLIGPVIFAAAALVTRKPMSSWTPWLAVLAIAGLNELADLAVDQSPNRLGAYAENVTDFLLTIAVPTVIMIAARRFPGLIGSRDPAGRLR